MSRISHLIFMAVLMLACSTATAQYGTQFDNRGFENWNGLEDEPYHWHSTQSASGTLSNMLPSGVIESTSHVRPGSTGTQSVKVSAKKVLSVVANGNLTNGRMNASSMSASGTNNYNYTDRTSNSGVHCTPLNGFVPDSITVWVCLYAQNASHQAKLYSAIHDDYNFKYISNATIDGASHLVKAAFHAFSRTTSDAETYTWQRLSVPYGVNAESSNNPATGTATDAKYVFVVITTNRTAGSGTVGDYLLADDILLIYNPTLATGTLASNTYNVGQTMTIPFTLTGTMSPENLNKAANEVIAELSDANGNFGSFPVEIGRVTTNVSGSITANIPTNIPTGTGYRVRVRSTNYPMTAPDNGSNITINGYSNIYANVSPENSGSIEIAGGTNYGQFSEGYFLDGSTINVTATANTGYSFANWTIGNNVVSANANYSFTLNGTTSLTANFAAAYTINVTANPTNGGTVTGGDTYAAGATAHLTATANAGFVFSNWTKDGTVVSTQANYDVTVTEDATYTANFVARHTITVTANPTEGGTVVGEGSYNEGETVTIEATPNNGYIFVNWTKNGTEVSANATHSFTATESATYTANFIARYVITVNANPAEGGTVEGGGSYEPNESVTLRAHTNHGYVFLNWTKGNTVVTSDTVYSFAATENATYNANFVEASATSFIITASAGEHGTITPAGEIEVTAGESKTFTIAADAEYEIVSVYIDGEDVGPISEYTFDNVEWNHSISAVFHEDGIKKAMGSNDIKLYPTPVANTLFVSGDDIKEVRIYSLNGTLLKRQNHNGGKAIQVNVSDLATGIYTVQCIKTDGTSTRKIIKK